MIKLYEEAVTGFDKMHKFCIGLRYLFFNAKGRKGKRKGTQRFFYIILLHRCLCRWGQYIFVGI